VSNHCSRYPDAHRGEIPVSHHCSRYPSASHGETPCPTTALGTLGAHHGEISTPSCSSPSLAPVSVATAPGQWDSAVPACPRAGVFSPFPAVGPRSARQRAHAPAPCTRSQRSASSDRCPAGARGLPAKPPLTKHILAPAPPRQRRASSRGEGGCSEQMAPTSAKSTST